MSESLLNRPMREPPPGVISNPENPSDQTALAYLTLAIALSTITLFTWIRFLVKLLIIGKLHLEDYLIPFAWLSAIGQIAAGFVINEQAPWVHMWDITFRTFGQYLLWYRLNMIFYSITILLIKVSMLVQILRIFVPNGTQSKTYYVIHGLIWSNTIFYTITIFIMLFTCQPVSKGWKPWLPGKCMNMEVVGMTTQVVNLAVDLSILFLTQRAVWGLMRVQRRQRIKLSIVFFAGIIPCGFAIVCLYYSALMLTGDDFTYDSAIMMAACYGETSSGMFVLFLPVLPRFFSHLKTVSTFASSRRAPSGIEFSNISGRKNGSAKSKDKKQSLWHVSYTQGDSDDKLPISPNAQREDYGAEMAIEKSDAVIPTPDQARKDSEASIHRLPIQGVEIG